MYIKMHEMNMDTQFVYVIITTNLKYCLQLKNYLHVQLTKSTRNEPKDNHVQVKVSFQLKLL